MTPEANLVIDGHSEKKGESLYTQEVLEQLILNASNFCAYG